MPFDEPLLSELRIEVANVLQVLENNSQLTKADVRVFTELYEQFLTEPEKVNWDEIQAVSDDMIRPYANLTEPDERETVSELNRIAVIKLNGGLGTGMGCAGPKSLIAVRQKHSFLDMAIAQIECLNKRYGSRVPLILMNSFNTDEVTRRALRRKAKLVEVSSFCQNRCPRICADTFLPMSPADSNHISDCWYPPGHGNVFQAMYDCGMMDKLIEEGRYYCFISNIDNTGASVDVNIVHLLMTARPDYVMEVTDKTPADVKGGTLIEVNNRIMHLELPQVPDEHVEDFKSSTLFKIFNTNNIWVNLVSAKKLIEQGKMRMEIIVNPKVMKRTGEEVLQVETSVGGAIRNFDKVFAVKVARSRFLPVKKTQDLLTLKSDLYSVAEGQLVLAKTRSGPLPLVKLSSHFDNISDFEKRIRHIPSMLSLVHLTVVGDVRFGRNVQLKGTVVIVADHGDTLCIPDQAVIENKVVTGSLRMTEH